MTISSQTDLSICPIYHLLQYLKQKYCPSWPLFTTSRHRPVSDKFFRQGLQKCLKALRLNKRLYTPHSFRIGGATFAQQQNYSDSRIQQLGRWRSSAFRTYFRPVSLNYNTWYMPSIPALFIHLSLAEAA